MGYNPSYKWINPTYPIYNWGELTHNHEPWLVRHPVDLQFPGVPTGAGSLAEREDFRDWSVLAFDSQRPVDRI